GTGHARACTGSGSPMSNRIQVPVWDRAGMTCDSSSDPCISPKERARHSEPDVDCGESPVYVGPMHCLVAATPNAPHLGTLLPLWSVVPFAAMLVCIAVLPLAAGKLWESNLNKAVLSAVLGVPVAIWTATLDPTAVTHAASEYLAFIVLLGALFVISGGIVVRGTLAGTPGLNAVLIAIGAVLASVIGTTGASMLLIRPLLRANSIRLRKAHVFVFFIFVVANGGGLLTP